MEMKRVVIIAKGEVQRAGFRDEVERIARKLRFNINYFILLYIKYNFYLFRTQIYAENYFLKLSNALRLTSGLVPKLSFITIVIS
jgi:hypothetical protein